MIGVMFNNMSHLYFIMFGGHYLFFPTKLIKISRMTYLRIQNNNSSNDNKNFLNFLKNWNIFNYLFFYLFTTYCLQLFSLECYVFSTLFISIFLLYLRTA